MQFQLRIEVNVTTGPGRGGVAVSNYVNDALQELTNRLDFRNGTMSPGRAFDCHLDHNDVHVTVDVNRLTVGLPIRPETN